MGQIIHHTCDAGFFIKVLTQFSSQLRNITRDSKHGYQVTSCTRSPDRNSLRIIPILPGMSFQPPDRRLAIVDLGWPARFISQPVIDGRPCKS